MEMRLWRLRDRRWLRMLEKAAACRVLRAMLAKLANACAGRK